MITDKQLDFFNKNGFLIIEDFADPKLLLEKAQELVQQTQDPQSIFKTSDDDHVGDEYFLSSGDKIRYFYEPKAFKDQKLIVPKQDAINKIGHGLHSRELIFKEFSTRKEIQDIACKLGFKDARILQSMLIFKMSKIGGEVPAHQDSTFIYTNPDSTIGFWFAMQDSTVENGCMEFWPGSHSLEISKRMIRSSKGGTEFIHSSQAPDLKDSDFIKYPTKAGTLVVIHGNVYHRSAENMSDKSRWIYTWHMIEGEYEYPKSNWLQTEEEFTKLKDI